MHSFDLNLDLVNGEGEEERTEALGSSELNGFIDYFLHGPDSDVVSQSNQGRRLPEEESISGSRVRNEGIDFVQLGLGLGLGFDSDTNNEAPFDLNVSLSDIEMFDFFSGEEAVQDMENESSDSSSSSSSMSEEVELVCEEDFQVVRDDAMMVDPPHDEVDIVEEGLGMIINAANDDEYGTWPPASWLNGDDHVLEQFIEQLFYAANDVGDDNTWAPAVWLEWNDDVTWADDTYWNMQTNVTCDVDNLPSVTLTQEELNKNNSICAICMENFCIEEKLKRLPCFHYYHVDCISPWLRTRNTCPTCRYELPIQCGPMVL